MAGTTTVAIATVTQINSAGVWETDSTAMAAITFVRFPNESNNLRFNAPGQSFTGNLPPNSWISGLSWYYWKQAETQILWGTKEGDDAHHVPITDTGIASTNLPSAPLSSSLAVTSGSTLILGSTTPTTAVSATLATTEAPTETSTSQIRRPTETSASQPPKPTVIGSYGLSDGAVAGVAIGCLIAGALIAGIVIWLCWGRRKRLRAQRSPSDPALMPAEKGFTAETIPLSSNSRNTVVPTSSLPQPLEDKAISGDISKISNSIKNHVQSYYHHNSVNPRLIDYDHIQTLHTSPPASPEMLKTLLETSATREIALRFCLAWVIVSRMQPYKEPSNSLLPPEVVQCLQETTNVEHGSKGA